MPSIFEKHPRKTIVVFVIILFIIMDITLSFSYRKIMEVKERTDLGIQHDIYHHDFLKNGESHETGRLGDYSVYTNSLGFKDKSIKKIPRKSDKRRIVFIGDSFTEGILLNYEDTFVGMIDSVVFNKNIEVLNAGRISYSPIIYWRKIKYLIERKKLELDELVVFIDISDIDDEATYYDLSEDGNVIYQVDAGELDYNEPRDYGISWLISNRNIENIRLFLRQNLIMTSGIVNFFHDLILHDSLGYQNNIKKIESGTQNTDSTDVLTVDNTWEYVLNDYRSNWTFDDQYYDQFGEIGKERMIKYMDRLYNLCKENDIKLSIVVYPWPSQIWFDDLNSRHVKIWDDWTHANNITFINLFPSFIKLNMSDSKKLEIISKYFVPYDLHYNRAGNELIANEFIKYYF